MFLSEQPIYINTYGKAGNDVLLQSHRTGI